jgi:hypothetical protein
MRDSNHIGYSGTSMNDQLMLQNVDIYLIYHHLATGMASAATNSLMLQLYYSQRCEPNACTQ